MPQEQVVWRCCSDCGRCWVGAGVASAWPRQECGDDRWFRGRLCGSVRCVVIACVQVLWELSTSRVFTLNGAHGVESIRCDPGVRPLLQQATAVTIED